MRADDQEVLQHLRDWLTAGSRPWLCTIVSATGSSPRPVGSMLALGEGGIQVGSVSGGCVEEDLVERIRAGEFEGLTNEPVEYGVSPEQNERLGLPCGGRLLLLLQRMDGGDLDWLHAILQAIEGRHCCERVLDVDTGDTLWRAVDHFSPLAWDGSSLRQCFGPRMRLLLVGAGQLARQLAELALAMDYEVLVTDPRQSALDQWEGPALPLLQGMPDDVVRERASDRHSIVITLTHDPRIDDMALMEALESDAWYVGALGSARTTRKRLERLRALELSEASMERLHAPVGLDIGSKTPLEIAVSIMAQLTQLRRQQAADRRP